MNIGRWLRTVGHLRPRQALGQLRVRLAPPRPSPLRWPRRAAPPWPGLAWRPRGPFLPSGPRDNDPRSILAGELELCGQRHRVGWPPDFDLEGSTRLWRYHLHYLEPLWALPFGEARALAEHWIRQPRRGSGAVGWEPYPTSLRLVNLCGVFFGDHRRETLDDPPFRDRLWRSVHDQAEWLRGNLEIHLLANHLLENAIALTAVGSCFSGPAAEVWKRTGIELLRRELPEQILSDGGHFERSPTYQARIAWGLAFLVNGGDPEVEEVVLPALGRCLDALQRLRHPDRQIALLNDSAFNMANPSTEVIDYARELGAGGEEAAVGPFALPVTGYFGASTDRGDYVIVDGGPIGPDYQPAHGHADLFSFELSLSARRVIVDSGTHDYEPSALRAYCRSTRAHNTVEVEGRDQCELWGVFRVGRRARPRDVVFRERARGFAFSAWHDGYEHLPGAPRHRRELVWHDSGLVAVRDTVRATRPVSTVSRLHLHPDRQILARGDRRVEIRTGGESVTILFAGEGELRLEDGTYCPRFGEARKAVVLAFHSRARDVRSGFVVARSTEPIALDLDEGVRAGAVEIDFGLAAPQASQAADRS